MNKFLAAFEILYLLSCADGEIEEGKLETIEDFLTANYGNIHFNTVEIIDALALTNGKGMLDEFKLAAHLFQDVSNLQDKLILLDFAYSLITADGHLKKEEEQMFYLLGNLWNINIDRYLSSKFLPDAV